MLEFELFFCHINCVAIDGLYYLLTVSFIYDNNMFVFKLYFQICIAYEVVYNCQCDELFGGNIFMPRGCMTVN